VIDTPVYDPFEKMDFRFDRCMITGQPIDPKEDLVQLFPDWLIHKYHLQGKSLQLLSGSTVRYPDMKVPVCRAARDAGLNYMNRAVGDLLTAGFAGINWLKPGQLYHFLVYLYYGVLYYEIYESLRNKSLRNAFLTSEDFKAKFRVLHIILQGAVRPVTYLNFDPGSMFILQVHDYKSPEAAYNLKIGTNTLTISLRIGEVGVMAALLDNGTQSQFYQSYFERFNGAILHPIQFDELYAKISYKAWLMNSVFDYGIGFPDAEDPSIALSVRIPDEKKNESVFRDWEDQVYGTILQSYLVPFGFPADKIFDKSGKTITFIETPAGKLRTFDADFTEIR